MSAATLTISRKERDALHWLMVRRLFILGHDPERLARNERVSLDELNEEFGEDLRLMADLGWEVEDDRSAVDLTMAAESLAKSIRRLRRDARRAPFSVRHAPGPKEDGDDRWRRFGQAVEVCEELLGRLDSQPCEQKDATPLSAASPEERASHELSPYRPVTDGFILAALERAALHEQEEEVLTSVLMEHLGFEWAPATNRLFFSRLEELRQAGLLTSKERRGEPFWSLTSVGRERLATEREAGEVGELPESPQHRAWRHARVEAALRLERFKTNLAEAWEATEDHFTRYHQPTSAEWFALSERLRFAAWRVGSATHCLHEWVEPADERPDVDEAPGLSPGRRAVSAWDQTSTKLGGPA